mmetsp:Transcript_20493/g.18128  ORF Transcript_20493/g.18128 Transcript_20493/m.18128 type:complete len:141 (-) Transcript_20493:239-661(-)
MYSGFIFLESDEEYPGFYTFATILVFLVNSYFILVWIYLLLSSFEWKNFYYQAFLKIYSWILRRRNKIFTTDGVDSKHKIPLVSVPKALMKGRKKKISKRKSRKSKSIRMRKREKKRSSNLEESMPPFGISSKRLFERTS